ncbi:uncharacterized protein LOC107464817 [Arachis duranensis]|uniref:Uncharacterized protein LOC107464817 n=1 Tax=Arachis duranensis TaxID=130453 RepID=A0A6P4BG51_ARADU|nr:uncharacterized protein LOC107464817 [Arachis duranensis]
MYPGIGPASSTHPRWIPNPPSVLLRPRTQESARRRGRGKPEKPSTDSAIETSEKKMKRGELDKEWEERKYGVVVDEEKEASLLENGKVRNKRKLLHNPADIMVSKEGFDDEEKLLRTIFVRNLPLKVKKKTLLKEFKKFSEVESVRIRSVPIQDTQKPKKGAILAKKINDAADRYSSLTKLNNLPSCNFNCNIVLSLMMLTCDHPVPLNRYNERVEEHLQLTDFYHASQIEVVQCQKALVNALIERWHPDIHTFRLPIGECAVTLEDVAIIFGLPTDGLLVTKMTMSSFEALEAEYLHQFGVAPSKSACRGSCIKLTWLRDLKENLQLTDENSIQRYVKCHIMFLIGSILFGDKSGTGVHWKYLPLLHDFGSIGQYSLGSACLTHLYRALYRASRMIVRRSMVR